MMDEVHSSCSKTNSLCSVRRPALDHVKTVFVDAWSAYMHPIPRQDVDETPVARVTVENRGWLVASPTSHLLKLHRTRPLRYWSFSCYHLCLRNLSRERTFGSFTTSYSRHTLICLFRVKICGRRHSLHLPTRYAFNHHWMKRGD